MPIIDADCHVVESEITWDYFIESELEHKPLTLITDDPSGETRRFLAIDGRLRAETAGNSEARQAQALAGRAQAGSGAAAPTVSRRQVREEKSGFARTTEAMRTMRDIEGRLRHMDQLEVDVQVLYPTTMA